jgi:perosamine synthetase
MLIAWLRASGKSLGWPHAPGAQVVLTHQARTALGLLCQLLKLGPADEVLLPAYNCGAEVDPYVQAGCKVLFYRIDRAANADVADIRRRMSPATRLVHITHFFGWPQELGDLPSFCSQRNVLLVEDCAQALFSSASDGRLGTVGDAIIYSFVKSMALPDGGALVLKQSLPTTLRPTRPPNLACTLRASLPLFKKWLMQHNSLWQKHPWGRRILNRSWASKHAQPTINGRREMLSSNCFNESRRFWWMSRVSQGLLNRTDVQEVIARRRRNFDRLHGQLRNAEHLLPLHDSLPRDVCPLAYPVYANDPAYARTYFEQQGILVQGWPGYYPRMPWDEYPDACALKDTLLTLPVHQDLTIPQMDYIATCANNLGKCPSPDTAPAPMHRNSARRRLLDSRAGL